MPILNKVINFPCIISHLIVNLVADLKVKTRHTPHGWSLAKSTKTIMEMHHNALCPHDKQNVVLCYSIQHHAI
jgi:hypothetical protein